MKKHKIDKVFKAIIDNNSDYYQKEASESKERIRRKTISYAPVKRSNSALIRILAAACAVLLIFCSVLIYILRTDQNKNRNLVELYRSELDRVKDEKMVQTNTVYIENYVYDTIVKIEKQEETRVEYLTRTVYKTDTIFQIIEQSNVNNDFASFPENEKNIDIQRYGNAMKQNVKNKKFRIRIGGNKNDLEDTQLAFRNK